MTTNARPCIALDLTPLLGHPTGVGVFTRELTRELIQRDELDLVGYAVTWRGRAALRRSAPTGVRLAERPMAARPLRRAWAHSAVPPVEWFTGGIDLVHGTNFVVPPTRRAARLVTVHDLTPVRYPQLCSADTLAYPRLIERAWRAGAWIHTDSRFVADEVRTWLGVADRDAERVVPIHLGVTPPTVGCAARGWALAGSARYVLALGTIEPRKGLVDLVRAFDELVDADDAVRGPAGDAPVHLVVAGPPGWGVAEFDDAVAACRNRRRIVRPGWVDDAERADLLAGASVLAYPSVYEGFGLPPLEAMAAGIPVVCSDAGPLPEVTGDAAVLVPARDPSALAAALAHVLSDDATRAAVVATGRDHAAGFRWERCAAAVTALYHRMLGLEVTATDLSSTGVAHP